MKKIIIAICFCLFYLQSQGHIKVLVCGTPPMTSYSTDIKNKLVATGRFTSVDTFDCNIGTPSIAKLLAYNAVLVYSDGTFRDSTLMGNNLAAYVDSGGGVVCAMFVGLSPYTYAGAFNDTNYTVIVPDSPTSYVTRTLGTVLLPAHPIMQGVHSFNGGHCSYESTSRIITGGSYRIANYDNGDLLIVAKENAGYLHNRRRADLNFYPPSSNAEVCFWADSTDGTQIITNALLWVRDSTRDTVIVAPSAVHGLDGGELITVYPNPNSGTATLCLPEVPCDVTIFDALGRQTAKFYTNEKNTPLEFTGCGLYTIRVVSRSFIKNVNITVTH